MATYNINKITLPNGDVCNLQGGGTATDVQINGTSITSSGVANIPYADEDTDGVVSTDTQHFSGNKYFDSGLIVIDSVARDTAVSYRNIAFKDGNITSGGNTVQNAVIISQTASAGSTLNNRMGFRIKSPNSNGSAYTSYYDTYGLPAATNDLTEDKSYNIITTKNLTDIPDASITDRGLVNATGTQKFAGYKRFVEGVVSVDNENAASANKYYTEIDFRDSKPSTAKRAAYILNRQQSSTSTLNNRFIFNVYSPNTAGTDYTSYVESYELPTATTNLTASHEYNIITTKNTKTVTASLATSGWTSSNTQTVTVTGMTADAIIMVSAAPVSQLQYRQNGVYCSAQAANSLTFTCATKPTATITVQILTIG